MFKKRRGKGDIRVSECVESDSTGGNAAGIRKRRRGKIIPLLEVKVSLI